MKVEILGSGGATATPRPGCRCPVCTEARAGGVTFSRTGPSTFVHGPDVLFDTPEESRIQLDRSGVTRIAGCFYSHWHPDHTMGRRVWETRNRGPFGRWPPRDFETTTIYLPRQVAADFERYVGLAEHFAFMAGRGWVQLVEVPDGEAVTLGAYTVSSLRLAESYVYAFLLEGEGRRVLVAPDELHGWDPPAEARGADLAVLPMGICEFHPLTGERRIDADHPVLRFEATLPETLAIVEALAPRRAVLSHVEEVDGLTRADLGLVEQKLLGEGVRVEFAYDTMLIEV